MRLTCPNCGAEYEVPEGVIPPGGKHVQCSACHTRWFMQGPTLSEDQILHRLENLPRTRPVLVPVPSAPPAPTEPDFDWESPEFEPEPEPDLVAEPGPDVRPRPQPVPAQPAAPRPAKPQTIVGRPLAAEPAVTRAAAPGPAALAPAAPDAADVTAPSTGLAASKPALLRSAPRLELSSSPAEPAALPARSRFARGLMIAVLLACLAIAAYVWRDGLAASVPATAPILQDYGQAVDAARDWLDQLTAPSK